MVLRDFLLMLLLAASFMFSWTLVGSLPALVKRWRR